MFNKAKHTTICWHIFPSLIMMNINHSEQIFKSNCPFYFLYCDKSFWSDHQNLLFQSKGSPLLVLGLNKPFKFDKNLMFKTNGSPCRESIFLLTEFILCHQYFCVFPLSSERKENRQNIDIEILNIWQLKKKEYTLNA